MRYTKDKCKNLNIRLNDLSYNYLRELSSLTGLSISECVRVVIDSYRVARGDSDHEDK